MRNATFVRRRIAALVWCPVLAAQADLTPATVDQLLARLADSTTHAAAANELLQHGRAAGPALAERLLAASRQREPEAWVTPSLRVLARMGPDGAAALGVLLELLRRTDSQLKECVFDAVGGIAPHAEQRTEVEAALADLRIDPERELVHYIPCCSRVGFDPTVPTANLLEGLGHADPFVRQLVCETLVLRHRRGGLAGKELAMARDSMLTAMASHHPRFAAMQKPGVGGWCPGIAVDPALVIRAASQALAVLAPELPESLLGHGMLLRDLDVHVRAKAARDLGLFGINAAFAADELTAALASDVLVAREAATALGQIGIDDPPVLAGLTAASRSADAQLAARAAAALRQLAVAKK